MESGFCELDRMSRSGQVRLTAKGPGLYAVTSITPYNRSMPAEAGVMRVREGQAERPASEQGRLSY